jgi:hypothetical protein
MTSGVNRSKSAPREAALLGKALRATGALLKMPGKTDFSAIVLSSDRMVNGQKIGHST